MAEQNKNTDFSERARKAAATRKEHEGEDAFKKMGEAGARERHNKSPEEESRIAKDAAATRKENNPQAFEEMGRKGGSSSHGGKSGGQQAKGRHEEEEE